MDLDAARMAHLTSPPPQWTPACAQSRYKVQPAATSSRPETTFGGLISTRSFNCTRTSTIRSHRNCFARTAAVRDAAALERGSAEDYNQTMHKQMGWQRPDLDPYSYHPERGLYYHEVFENLICGSQPRSASDIDSLKDLLGGQGTILNLQQDKDLAYWGVDLGELCSRAEHRGIQYLRRPAQDFDPHSLRRTLPGAAVDIHRALSSGRRIYVHCTAGLGRAPAACIAYLYWFQSFQLADAYRHLTDIRPCGPKWDAIRGATYDLLDGRGWDAFEHLPSVSYTELNGQDKENLRNNLFHNY